MHRRGFLARGLSLAAAPLVTTGQCRLFASGVESFSTRAIDLVKESNVVDMLGLLTLNWPLLDRWRSSPGAFEQADFSRLRESGIDVFYPAVAFDDPNAHEITAKWFDDWNRFIAAYPGYLVRIDSLAALPAAQRDGKIGIILGMQDANYIRTTADVDAFYRMGQRIMQLTYNSANRLGFGCAVTDRGLTDFGHDVIRRMNELGMAVDVSHCGERTSLDAIAVSSKPVLITHSNCRALAPSVTRCKSDETIRAMAKSGGVLGLTCVRRFVRETDPVTVEHALDHFDYAIKLAGIEHVGVGSDMDLHGRDSGDGGTLKYDIAGLNDPRRMFRLTEGLIRRGYTDDHIRLILGGNFRRAIAGIWS